MKRSKTILLMSLLVLVFSILLGTPNQAGAISNETMVSNMISRGHVPSGKQQAVSSIATTLLNEGFEPTFVAGLCANVIKEGSFGRFESSAYSSNEPSYLVYMDNNYNYRNTYSGQSIYNGYSLSTVKSLLTELQNGGWQGKFGLGSVQWTGGRTLNLVNIYISYAGGNDTITYDQCVQAEMYMIINELNGSYRSVINNWRNSNSNRNTLNAAYDAGWRICMYYESPSNASTKAVERGNLAKQLYIDMGIDTQPPVISNVQITDVTKDGYTVTCNVSDDIGVERVAFPTWTGENWQDDIVWQDGILVDGTATFHVKISDHGNQIGDYLTYIYAYDAAGNASEETDEIHVYVTIPSEIPNFDFILPSYLTVIGEEAFMGISARAVKVPVGCTTIASRAFANCPNLVYIYIPSTVTSIADDAFEGSENIVINRD